MIRKCWVIIGLLRILYGFSHGSGLFPLRYNKKHGLFKYSKTAVCVSILVPIFSFAFPIASGFYYILLREYIGFDFFLQNGIHIFYNTGSTLMLFTIHWKCHKKVTECALILFKAFQTIYSHYVRHSFNFDAFFLITLTAEAILVVVQVGFINLGGIEPPGFVDMLLRISLLMSTLIYFYVTIVYLMIGALFDNILKALEKNYEKICTDKQIEDKEIYFDQTFELYLQLKKCFEQFQKLVSPLWAIAGCYLAMSFVYNLRELYFGTTNDKEENVVLIELNRFLVMVLAASMVTFKAKRVERYLGVFCLEGLNSQSEDLEWIDFSKLVIAEPDDKILRCISLHPFTSIVNVITSAILVEMFISKSELFEKDE